MGDGDIGGAGLGPGHDGGVVAAGDSLGAVGGVLAGNGDGVRPALARPRRRAFAIRRTGAGGDAGAAGDGAETEAQGRGDDQRPRFRRLNRQRLSTPQRDDSASESLSAPIEPGGDARDGSDAPSSASEPVRWDGYTGEEPDCIIRPILTSESRRIRLGTTVYVEGLAFTLREVRNRGIYEPNVGPPYYGLTGEAPPHGYLKMTTDDDQLHPETVYWVSHLRVEASLPRQTSYPVSGLARRRFIEHTLTSGRHAAQ